MKTQLLKLTLITGFVAAAILPAQSQTVSTFENLTLSPDSYWDGSSNPMGTTFTSGNGIFPNFYDTAWAYWASGWAYSNMKDSTTAGYTNMYSARTASGYNNSANYIIGQQASYINLNATAIGKVVNGFYITNGTYAAISMRDGDAFAKKFGSIYNADGNIDGTNGEDWFLLNVHKYLGGVMTNDSVNFYLADYRFADSTQDYIVTEWQWVDLTSLGNADSLFFTLTSSDNGMWGMNTPAFFCVDDFTTSDAALALNENENPDNSLYIYPNPAMDILNIDLSLLNMNSAQISIADVSGKQIYTERRTKEVVSIDLSGYGSGIYFVSVLSENNLTTKKIVKK